MFSDNLLLGSMINALGRSEVIRSTVFSGSPTSVSVIQFYAEIDFLALRRVIVAVR